MAVTIALLQGVNVGKYKRISMADFKSIVANLGGRSATTVANSGNVVFAHNEIDADTLRMRIEDAASEHIGIETTTITRSAQEFRDVIANNPFPQVTDPKCMHVEFLVQPVANALDDLDFGNDDLHAIGREIYLHAPNKMSGITYDAKTLGKRLGTQHTSRNWSTITRLADIATKLEASSPE